jgi:hypothetical protein
MKGLSVKSIAIAGALLLTVPQAFPAGVSATFVQLNRAAAAKSAQEWSADLDKMSAAGLTTLIVQWSAEGDISYFQTDLPFKEQYDALEKLFEAAAGRGFSIVLGLQNDPGYWKQITARDRVLRDYFLTRVDRNEKLQRAILARFNDAPEFTGYYIPDEIDDLTWRTPGRRALLKQYLALMAERLRHNDPRRPVAVSAFFRGRTAPDIFAGMLRDICDAEFPLDALLIQDGVGVGDPPVNYVPLYFKVLKERWSDKAPRLWGVIEAFEQTSKTGEPFSARPAPARRLEEQVRAAEPYFEQLVLFTFPDYADPARGEAAAALFEALKKKN